MHEIQRMSDLNPSREQLVRLMQRIGFGRVENLLVRSGDPVLEGHRVKTEIRLPGQNGPRPEVDLEDFVLRSEVLEMFARLDQLRDGVVESIQVKHGLPFLITVDGPLGSR